jgi:hypothetical protein
MPDISYQQQLLQQMQDPRLENSPMGAMRALGTSIGNAWQGYESGQDEKALVDFFTNRDTTPENLQKFMAEHPRMPQVDVYTRASIVGRQRKMKDVSDSKKNLEGYIKSYGEPPQNKEHWDGILQGSATIEDVSNALKAWKEAYPGSKLTEIDPEKDLYETIGGKTILKRSGVKKEEKASEWVIGPDGKTIRFETPTEARRLVKEDGFKKYEPDKGSPLSDAVKQLMTEKGMTASEAYKEANKKPYEVNVSNEIDTILGGMFPGYYRNEAVRESALAYYGTPEGAKEVQTAAAKYNKSKAPDIYNVVPGFQTQEGQPAAFNVRSGAMGGGTPLQKTPSESDIKEARTKTTMDAVIGEFEKSFGMTNDGVITSVDPKNPINKTMPSGSVERVAGYPARAVSILAQSDPKLSLADKLSKGFLAKFARAAGEVGTLTDQDIGRAEQLVPSINDVPEVRAGKMTKIRALATEIYERGKRQEYPLKKGGSSSSNRVDKTIVERRASKNRPGVTLIKYSDGTIGEE